MEINLNVCYGQPNCAPRKTIERFFYPDIPKLQYVYINNSFEFSSKDIENPVKPFADDSLFWPLELKRTVETNLYLRKAQFTMNNRSWFKYGSV